MRSEAVLELGKLLVSQLDTDADLLASWMAHYVAQLMKAAEQAPSDATASAQDSCARAILELWRYRATLPVNARSFEDLGPIRRTLASLDPDRDEHRYYPEVLREAETANADEDAARWLKLAISYDFAARMLIRSALQYAARRASSTVAPWVELARRAGTDDDAESIIVDFALEGDDEGGGDKDARDAAIKNRIAKLEVFVKMAAALTDDLRAQVGADTTTGKE